MIGIDFHKIFFVNFVSGNCSFEHLFFANFVSDNCRSFLESNFWSIYQTNFNSSTSSDWT